MLPCEATIVLQKLTSTFLTVWLCGTGVAPALDKPSATPEKPAPVQRTADDSRRNAAEAGAAIEALGANPATRKISAIVFKAVRSSPESALHIVSTAARISPQAAVPEIVTAAVAAVPNPWKQVTYRRLTALDLKKSAPDFKGGPDGKQTRDGGRNMDLGGRGIAGASARGAGDPGANPASGIPMTLAEAIAQAAADAQPGLSLSTLQAAVDIALLTDPATLLRQIQSPNAISGVGDAGLSNYANEPLRTPRPPAVSR